MDCPTVNIKLAPSDGNPTGLVVINVEDFDAATMTLFNKPVVISPELQPPAAATAPSTATDNNGTVSPPWRQG
jgi:hypothetical protein